jgi:quercetin dioxygenase-like cupin family protein
MSTEIGQAVRAGAGIAGGAFGFLNGNFLVKVNGEGTRGKLTVVDTERTARGGPPLHFHHLDDEWFQVVEGLFDVSVGGVEYRLAAGDSILGPAGVAHAFTNVSETGRLLLVFSPAGRMEAFFRDVAARGAIAPDVIAEISAAYGMPVVGPPIPIRHN